jgi:hypothetical protein
MLDRIRASIFRNNLYNVDFSLFSPDALELGKQSKL